MFRFNPEGFEPLKVNHKDSLDSSISDTDTTPELEFSGEGFELIPEMISMRAEIFSQSSNVWELEGKIGEFVARLGHDLSHESLENCAAYYILIGQFEDVIKATRFDLDEDYSMFAFLKTLQPKYDA